jgi:radical SAM protein with 4Fe4S-binding SPASM domain
MDKSEQWKLEGDCKECRRKNYCGKDCKAHREATYSMIYGMVAKAMLDTMTRKKV